MENQILRMTASYKEPGGDKLPEHILGIRRPGTAVKREGLERALVLEENVEAARIAVEEALARRGKRRGKQPCRSVDLVMGGPPPYASKRPWPQEKILDWARVSLDWIKTAAPHAVVSAAAVHQDETSPHLHVQVAPITMEREEEVLGIEAFKRALAGTSRWSGRRLMSAVQDQYHAKVCRDFGLERGQRRSSARHGDTDPVIAIEGRLRLVEEKREEVAQASARMSIDLAKLAHQVEGLRKEKKELETQARGMGLQIETTQGHLAELERKVKETRRTYEVYKSFPAWLRKQQQAKRPAPQFSKEDLKKRPPK